MKPKIFLALILVPVFIFAQNPFNIEIDYTRFFNAGDYSTLEFYYSFNKSNFSKLSNSKIIEGNLNIKIFNADTQIELINDSSNFVFEIDEINKSENILTGLVKYYLLPGNYKTIITGTDLNNKSNIDKVELIIDIPQIDTNASAVSDIELAASIIQDSKNYDSPFYKNTCEIVPNPSSIYGAGLPVLFFYYEIYRPKKTFSSENININYKIIDQNNRVIFNKSKKMRNTYSSIVDIGAIPINKLLSGKYSLFVEIKSEITSDTITTSKNFYVYNPELIAERVESTQNMSFISSEYVTMDEEELDYLFNQATYLSSDNDKKEWATLTDVNLKREFLFNFWQKFKTNPDTDINEIKNEYQKRIDYSNDHFGNLSQKEGWKTDRGRVFIIYGKPSDIERNPNSSESYPYEIWTYEELEGGAKFIFADFSGYSNYKLIHSTKRGELNDPNWQNAISK